MNNLTNSPLATLSRISTRNSNARTESITKFTLHHAAGVMTSQSLLNWGHDPRCTGSWQYGVGGRIIHQLICESRRAWTSSSAWNDQRAITVEMTNSTGRPNWEVSLETWNTTVELAVDCIMRNPGITRRDGKTPGLWFDGTKNGSLTTHDMFVNTECPGPFVRIRLQQFVREVNAKIDQLLSNSVQPPVTAPTFENPVHVVRPGETLGGIARQHHTTVAELQRLNTIPNANVIRIGQIIRLPETNNTLNSKNNALNGENNALNTKNNALNSENNALNNENSALNGTNNALNDTNPAANHPNKLSKMQIGSQVCVNQNLIRPGQIIRLPEENNALNTKNNALNTKNNALNGTNNALNDANPTKNGTNPTNSAANHPNKSSKMQIGSQVRVNQNASRWSTGQTIPKFVRGGKYNIQQLRANNTEVLIGRNGVATGWISVNDLTLV